MIPWNYKNENKVFINREKNGVPYLFDIAGTPYTIHHSSIAYLFTQYYHLPYESIYKVVVACMLSNYDLDT